MRVLIVRIGAMGDVLHALPAVAALREKHPKAFIGWAIEPRWSDLLQIAGDPDDMTQGIGRFAGPALIDRWYAVPTGNWKKRPLAPGTFREIRALKEVLRRERFDLCVDMQGAVKSAGVGLLAQAKLFAGPAEPREKFARKLYDRPLAATAPHVIEQGCELLGGAIGEVLTPARVTLPMEETAESWADEVIADERFCLISPGGGWGAKLWPAQRFGQLAAALARRGIRSLVNTSPTGSPEADQVVTASNGYARAVPCSIRQLIALTRRAAVVVGGDTGPLHLAAALERPVVGIFGPTDPARNGPYRTRARIFRDAESITSHKRQKEPEPGLLRISVDEVIEAVIDLLG